MATEAASASAGATGTTTGPSGIQNLVITSAERSELTAAFLAPKGIPPSEVAGGGPMPGSVYYAYDPATATYWAAAVFTPIKGLSLGALEAFDNGGSIGMFRKAGAGSWQLQTVASSLDCLAPHFFVPPRWAARRPAARGCEPEPSARPPRGWPRCPR
jgi:hypothetical protein